jgi:hypothetical protein
MTCPSCSGHGVFRSAYHEGQPVDFAICLCAAGEPFRVTENNGKAHVPHYQVWAIRSGHRSRACRADGSAVDGRGTGRAWLLGTGASECVGCDCGGGAETEREAMSEPTLTAYVQRCQAAMAKYQHLRFMGMSHEIARKQSGFEDAVMGRPDVGETLRDVKRIVAGDAE